MESRVYVSSAIQKFTTEQLTELLAHCRLHNSAKGITGVLLYRDGKFIQAIEGEPEVLDSLMERIQLDDRHEAVTVLLRETIEARRFPNWLMGFWQPTDSELRGVPGYTDLFDGTHEDWLAFAADRSKSKRLLAALAPHL
jgi:hypothetical protein